MVTANANELNLVQEIEKINRKLDTALTLLQAKPQSDLKELNAALALAQAEFRIARPSRENNYFKMKYESLEDVVRASRPALAKNGLSVRVHARAMPDGANLLECVMAHSSGQQVESTMRVMPSKNDPRSVVSEIEYLKRILYSSLTGVVADDDDDAEMAMAEFRETEEKGTALNTAYNPKENTRLTITPEQLKELNYELEEQEELAKQVLRELHLKYLADMPRDKFRVSMQRIREIKAVRSGTR